MKETVPLAQSSEERKGVFFVASLFLTKLSVLGRHVAPNSTTGGVLGPGFKWF